MSGLNIGGLLFWAGLWSISYHYHGTLGLGITLILTALFQMWAEAQ